MRTRFRMASVYERMGLCVKGKVPRYIVAWNQWSEWRPAKDARVSKGRLFGNWNGWKLCLFQPNLGRPALVNPMVSSAHRVVHNRLNASSLAINYFVDLRFYQSEQWYTLIWG
ncbi:MAG: hypothetical protein ACFFCW_16175 [Candidatus Hodarchaeota archaeon]